MFKNSLFILLISFFISISNHAQENQGVKPNLVTTSTSMRIAEPLAKRTTLIPPKKNNHEIKDGRYTKDKRSSRGKMIIGKGSKGDDLLAKIQQSNTQRIPGATPELVFDTAESNSAPTDPSLAVGPNHVFAVFNTGWIIYDKAGNALTEEIGPNNIFSPGSCCDLTISYDNAADRWVMSILYSSDGHTEVAVSQGPDPVNDAWAVYSFADIEDYQKLSIWSDGYYMTSQIASDGGAGNDPTTDSTVFVFDRNAMLAGEATAQMIGFPLPGIANQGFYSPQAFNISDDNMPAAGNAPIVFFQDDAYTGITQDHLKIWTANVDFTTPANSTISEPVELPTTPFISVFDGGSFANLTQPGGQDIDALQGIIMNQAQFRKFPTHNSAVFNFVVDTDGTEGEAAGIRWYELRQNGDGQPWTIFQEGTYTSSDSKHAWNASLIMDDDGNIGMGYTGMNGTTDTFVSSYYTGRYANDPLGTMTIDETLIATGSGNIPNPERYGDYSKIDLDPSNGEKFWFVNEYINTAGNRANVAGVFQLAPSLTNDVGVVSIDIPAEGVFSNTEEIRISIFNFGSASASNFEVSYQIDGGAVVTETFTGTIESTEIAEYTFTQRADLSTMGQSYTITASSNLSADQLATNNETSITTTNLFLKDIGITAITSLVSGDGLGDENVTVTIENFGAAEQSNFEVSYIVSGAAPIVETVAGPLAVGGTLNYTFTQTVNLSAAGSYDIIAATMLTDDGDSSNDSSTITIDSFNCLSVTNSTAVVISEVETPVITSTIDIANNAIISDINVTVNVEHTWNADLTMTLTAPDNTTIVELTSQNGGNSDNYTNTVFDDQAANSITSGDGPFTGIFQPEGSLADFNGLPSEGTWTLTISDAANQDGGQLTSWSIEYCSVDSNILGVVENFAPDSNLNILYKDNNQFDISLETTQVTERLDLDVFNLMGQRLLNYRLQNNNGRYDYNLDMSYAPKGVYLVRLSNSANDAKLKRIIVR